MTWTLIDKAKYIPELRLCLDVIDENPAWINDNRTGIVYYSSQSGFGCLIFPGEVKECTFLASEISIAIEKVSKYIITNEIKNH